MDWNSAMRSYEDPPDSVNDWAHAYRFQDFANNVKWEKRFDTLGSASEPISGTTNWGTATYTGTGTDGQFALVLRRRQRRRPQGRRSTSPPPRRAPTWSMRINTGEGFLPPVALDTSRCRPNWVGPEGERQQLADRRHERRRARRPDQALGRHPPRHAQLDRVTPARATPSRSATRTAPASTRRSTCRSPTRRYRLFDDKDEFVYSTRQRLRTRPSASTMTQIGDFNGDGIADLVDFIAGVTAGVVQQGYREPHGDAARSRRDPRRRRSRHEGQRRARHPPAGDLRHALGRHPRALRNDANIPAGLRDTHVPSAGRLPDGVDAKGRRGAQARRRAATPRRAASRTRCTSTRAPAPTSPGAALSASPVTITIDQTTGDVTEYELHA